MHYIVGQTDPQDIETDEKIGVVDVRCQSFAYGFFNSGFFKRKVSQIPNAIPYFLLAGVQRLCREYEMTAHCGRIGFGKDIRGAELHRCSGQTLRDGVVEFDGQTGSLVDFELGFEMCELFPQKRMGAAVDDNMQKNVPENNQTERAEQKYDRRYKSCRRPPGRQTCP